MPRPRKCRFVGSAAPAGSFKPVGIPADQLTEVRLELDELEALRLVDAEGLYQEDAAERMGISRPTISRLLQTARQKVAVALCEGRLLVVGGGVVAQRPAEHAQRCCGGRRRQGAESCGHRGRGHGPGQGNCRHKGERHAKSESHGAAGRGSADGAADGGLPEH